GPCAGAWTCRFFFQAEDGIRDRNVTGVQTCALPISTRGAGTGLVGGCTPVCGGVVLCTMRMNKILNYDLENFAVTVQPGVLLQQLADDALTHGCLYPPDPGEQMATLGGNVATNAGGMPAVK